MRPAVTVLQLDTHFPRIAGDVACPQTFLGELEILRVPRADVAGIVTARPEQIDITPFETALQAARGEVIVTSCGFLSFWQAHLAAMCDRPFISSALRAFEWLDPAQTLAVTFDAAQLTNRHFPGAPSDILGLAPDMHLRQVIEGDQRQLDAAKAGEEIGALLASAIMPQHQHVLLECTNLPPYKKTLSRLTGRPIFDILTEIERHRPGSIHPDHL